MKAVLCPVTGNIPMLLCDSLDGKFLKFKSFYLFMSRTQLVSDDDWICLWLIYVPLYLNDSLFKYFTEVSGQYLLHPCYLYFSISIK